jgi:Zn-dependent protease with chaperone function
MSFLLMVFLTVLCLYDGYQQRWANGPTWAPVLAAAGTVVLVGLHSLWVSRRVVRRLAHDPAAREQLLARYERWRYLHQVVQVGLFVLLLGVFDWGWLVRNWRSPANNLPGQEVLTLLPFLLGQVISWLFFYDADRAAHRAAGRLLEPDAFGQTWLEARQAHPVPFDSRWSYLAFQVRQKLALVFIPVLMLIALKELVRLVPPSWQEWHSLAYLVGAMGLAIVFVSMPLLVRVVLGLHPLPAGPLRDRLLAASRRLDFRASDILLWNTRSGMANAMVIGLLPWLRYVVFTDRLLAEFTEDEVEAVFGHEVGHVRHRHMLYYLVFLTGSMAVLGLLADHYLLPLLGQVLPGLASEAREAGGMRGDVMLFPVVGLLLGYIFVVFGFLSRRCERQADVFGCRAVSCSTPDCHDHDDSAPLSPGGTGLCTTGIRTFIRALEKVARVNGINRDRPGFLQSWQHSTIARRVEFLDRVLLDQEVETRFQRRLLLTKWGLMAFLGVAFAVLVALNGFYSEPPRPAPPSAEAAVTSR